MSTGRIDNFVGAQNFCTGSQTDFSTCIANNLRFLPFNEDTYEASGYGGINIREATLPYISGTSYVIAQPMAIANVLTRQLQKNSFGVVSFRCPDVFSKPRMPLPRLQDLGLPAEELLNITDVDMSVPDPSTALDFYGIPLVDLTLCTDEVCRRSAYFKNSINLSIGYTRALSIVVNKSDLIQGTINNVGDYYALPEYATDLDDKNTEAALILDRLVQELTSLQLEIGNVAITPESQNYYDYMIDMTNIATSLCSLLSSVPLQATMYTNVVEPLVTSIDEFTDFTTYDFEITSTVSEYLRDYNYDELFNLSILERQIVVVYGTVPRVTYSPENYQILLSTIGVNYSSEVFSEQSSIITFIQRLYNYSQVPQLIDETRTILSKYDALKLYGPFYTTNLLGEFDSGEPEHDAAMNTMVQSTADLLNQFTVMYSGGNILDNVEAIYNPEDSNSKDRVAAELDLYFSEVGDPVKINLARHHGFIIAATQVAPEQKVEDIKFGTDFKDSGVFHFADIAYSIGFSRLTNLTQITIEDEVYDLTAIVDEDGNPLTGISQSGCTKFTFTRHVMPTYSPVIEMYIYPGTPDQPYCPTINKYHNFAACSYSGMFSKLLPQVDQNSGSDMGLYVYKGYRPMTGVVEELIRIGKVDINSINLNDPSLDNKSYEAMIQQEVLNLTNASSIVNDTITTDDLKYYSSSKIVDQSQLNNYLNMAIVEFKQFPIGTSFTLPKISLLVTAEDPVLGV